MKQRLRYLLIGLALLIVCIVAIEAYFDRQEEKAIQNRAHQIIRYLPERNETSFHNDVDHIRHFIQAHSDHRINEEFRSLWRDPAKHYKRFLNRLEEPDIWPPTPMECSTRADLMRRLLKEQGYRSRMVDIFAHREDFPSHTFLEVFNPLSENWEIADPDLNIYWISKETGQRVGIRELISSPLNKFLPCSSPEKCGWSLKHAKDVQQPIDYRDKGYFGLARIKDYDTTNQAIYHSHRFNLEQEMPVEGKGPVKFCTIWDKICDIGLQDVSR